MNSRTIELLADAYLAAHRSPAHRVPAEALWNLDAAGAMAVQSAVLQRLGESVSLIKVAAPSGGRAVAAPIIDSWVTSSGGTLKLGGRNLMGLEIEVAAVLKTALTPRIARMGKAAVLETIDHFVVGIELIGTRIDRHMQAGQFGPLSDWMLTAGYVTGTQIIGTLPDIENMPMTLETAGSVTQLGRATHPFGGVLEPIMAYASAPFDDFESLRAGMTITTGSLSPLIKAPLEGTVHLRLGDFDPVSVTLS